MTSGVAEQVRLPVKERLGKIVEQGMQGDWWKEDKNARSNERILVKGKVNMQT
jgi:hypothetical protein